MAINWNDNNAVMQARQKAIAAGYKAADVDEFIARKKNENATIEIAKQGALTPEAAQVLIKDSPQLANQLAQMGLLPSQDKASTTTEGERTRQNLSKSGLSSLKEVERMLEEDPSLITKQQIPGKFQSKKFDAALFNAVDSLLRVRTGATAPEEEIRRYMSSFGPTLGDSVDDVNYKFGLLRDNLVNEGGLDEEQIKKIYPNYGKQQDEERQSEQFQSVGQTQQNQPQNQTQAQEEFKGHPVFGKSILGAVMSGRFDAIPQMAEQTAEGYNKKFASPEGQVDLVTGFSSTPRNVASSIVNLPKDIKNAVSLKNIGQRRDAAVEAGKDIILSGDDIAQVASEYVQHDPLAKNVWNKIKPSLEGQQIALPDLMKKLNVWSDAYTQAGRVGKSAEAGVNNVLYRKGRELVAQYAPEVDKATKDFARSYATRKTARRVIPFLAGGIGLGAGGNILSDLILGKD
jgi:hypothetical protein